MSEAAPHSTEILVLPASGEVVDLNDPSSCARALRDVRDLESMLRDAKGTLTDAIAAQSSILGSKTLHLEGIGKVEVKGGTDTIYDALAVKRDLLAAGMPPERVSEIVRETIDYQVVASEAKKAASANPTYKEIIERHRRVFTKRPSISIPPQGGR